MVAQKGGGAVSRSVFDGDSDRDSPTEPERKPRAQGSGIVFPDLDPWPSPVNGAAMLDDIARVIRRHIVIDDPALIATTLFVVHTYCLDVAEANPRLWLRSPIRECGKTQLVGLLGAIVYRPLAASSITAAALFRVIEAHSPTLLLDEIDNTNLRENADLRAVLNSGHTRDTAYVIRCEGDRNEPRVFGTWCSMILAGIGDIPDTTASRSIRINMRRKLPTEQVERTRQARLGAALLPLRRRILKWTEDYMEALAECDPDLPESLGNRERDNWRPLIGIADVAGGTWPMKAREAAGASRRDGSEETAAKVELLQDIRTVWGDTKADRLTSKALVASLLDMEDRPWKDWSHGRGLTQSGLARMLRDFGPSPKNVRFADGIRRGYIRGDFEDCFKRYLPSTDVAEPVAPDVAPQGDVFDASVSQCSGVAAEEVGYGKGDAYEPEEVRDHA
jgi:putative DNA primase/helicase